MKLLIVEDEDLARALLIEMIEKFRPDAEIIESVNSEDAIKQFEVHHPDLVLLDIHIPGINGIELAYLLSSFNNPPAVIFTTAHDEYAIQAFNANAIDYLLKPINPDRLEKALLKAEPITRKQSRVLKEEGGPRTYLTLKKDGETKLVPLTDVIYFKAEKKYVTAKTMVGDYFLYTTLNKLEDEFSNDFIRTHRNAFVSKSYLVGVKKIDSKQCHAIIRYYDDIVKVSRRQLPIIRRWLRTSQY